MSKPRITPIAPALADGVGLFGKVPTEGDFVSLGLAPAIETRLVHWLQAGLQASELALGRGFHRLFHEAPAWRFVVGRSLWGEATVAGVLLASTDRVGRSFPLVLVAQIATACGHPSLFRSDESWFKAAEALARTTRAEDFAITSLRRALQRLGLPRPSTSPDAEGPGNVHRVSLWWSLDHETGRTRGFETDKAPQGADFLRLLTSVADEAGSEAETARESPPAPLMPAPDPEHRSAPPRPAMSLAITLGSASHAGARLSVNADALLIQQSPSLFAIADGVGDGADALDAARVIINALGSAPACDTLEALVHEVKGKLGRAHSLVQSLRTTHPKEPASASVVSLALKGDAFAVIWAGNARCYLLRDSLMRCLTRDHVAVGIRFALLRSVGSRTPFMPEVITDTAQVGDRLLLCSAALTRSLDERTLADIVLKEAPEAAAQALIHEALIADVRENVSAIVMAIGRA